MLIGKPDEVASTEEFNKRIADNKRSDKNAQEAKYRSIENTIVEGFFLEMVGEFFGE